MIFRNNDKAENERQRLHCKNAIHLAVPMAKKYPGDKASSTSTPHVIAMVRIYVLVEIIFQTSIFVLLDFDIGRITS